jgi:hypothetical protein
MKIEAIRVEQIASIAQGVIPNRHQATDTFERAEPEPVECTEEFEWELLRRSNS